MSENHSGGKANDKLLAQIPSVAIMEIVRPNWALKKKIGTNLNVSHVGFVLRTEKGLIYRHASLTEKKIIDVPLIDYLKKYKNSKTVKGINILAIPDRKIP